MTIWPVILEDLRVELGLKIVSRVKKKHDEYLRFQSVSGFWRRRTSPYVSGMKKKKKKLKKKTSRVLERHKENLEIYEIETSRTVSAEKKKNSIFFKRTITTSGSDCRKCPNLRNRNITNCFY